MGRASVAAVGWVTGRRAGAPHLLAGEGKALGCSGASVPPRARRWSHIGAQGLNVPGP